jgi:hypothetical protein
MTMNENIKFWTGQITYVIIAFLLMILPFFIAKWNMPTHYIFSFLSFTVLLRNVLVSKKKTIPVILLLIGAFFILGYLHQAKTYKESSESQMKKTYGRLNQ